MKTKICLFLVFAILIGFVPQFAVNADEYDLSVSEKDKVVLTIEIGSEEGQLKYSDSMEGGGEGPEAFTVTADEIIYIVDNVNKRVNVYKDGKFLYDIAVPYITYVRSVVVSQEKIYLMDYDDGAIYVLDSEGNLAEHITIPDHMESYLMRKLYVQDNGDVWLYYENEVNGKSNRGEDCSYLVENLAEDEETYIEGFVKDENHTYSIAARNSHSALISTKTSDSLECRLIGDVQVSASEFLADVKILDIDENNCVFVDIFEMINAPIVAGEYTVRKYVDGECIGIAPIDLGGYYFMPNNVIEVSEDGNLYQIKCYADKVQVLKKVFIETELFQSNINNIKEEVLALEAEPSSSYAVTAVNAPNNQIDTMNAAMNCCDLSWTYKSDNANNPSSSTVTIPDYLVNVSKPSDQKGIPYCWGGFDGISTSSSTSWSSFSDAIDKNKFAGNVNTSTSGYQSGTAGLDCSGFVSSAAGFTYKLSTSNLASSTYTTSVSLSERAIYDIYVKSGTHVVYYVGAATDGIKTRESTTTGDDKTKLYSRSASWLSGYSLRRFHGW